MTGWFRYHQRVTYVLLTVSVDECYRELFIIPNRRRNHMANVSVNVGHKVEFSLSFLDQHGNPMVTTPTPDSAPVWVNTNSAAGALTAAANGLTAEEVAVAPGSDTVSVHLAVGGNSFTATVDLTVQAEPQVLTSVAIVATVV